MSQNNGPISRLVNQGISNAAKPKKAAPPRMAPTAADYLLGRAQVPQPPAQAPNPIANQQRQNAQAVRRMSPGIDRVANPSNERRVQIRANTPGTPENTRELVRRQVATLPIPDEKRAEIEALVDSALFIRTTYIDPETGMRRRVSPLASQNAIRQTGLLDPSDAMEVVELLKTEGGVRLLKTEVEQFRAQRNFGRGANTLLEKLAAPGNVDPNIAGIGAVIDTLSPGVKAINANLVDNPDFLNRSIENYERFVLEPLTQGVMMPYTAGLEPLRMLGVDPTAIQRTLQQFPLAINRGMVSGAASMVRIPQLLGSKEWADLADHMERGVRLAQANKPLDETFANELAGVVGAIIPQIAPALITGGSSIGASVAGRVAASIVFGATEAATNAAGGFDRAVKSGRNPFDPEQRQMNIEEARQRAFRAWPVDMIASIIFNKIGVFGESGSVAKKAFMRAFAEGEQEAFQTALGEYVATGDLDFNSPEVRKGRLFGWILGPAMGGALDIATGTQMEGGAEAVPPQAGLPIQRISASTIEDAYANVPDYGEDLPEGSLVGAARWRDTETLRTAIIEDGMAPPPTQSGGSSAVNAGYAAQYKRYVDLFNRVSRSTYNVNNATISRDTFNKEVELLRDLHIEFWREASRPQPAQRVSANTIERSYQGIDEGPELSAGALVNLAQQFAPQSQPQPAVTPSPAQQPSGTRGESAVVETNLQDPQARAKAISESPIPGATEAAWSSGDQRIVVGVERIQDAISRVGTSPSPKEKDVVHLLTTMHKVRARAEAAGVDIDPAGELKRIEARMRDLGYEVDPGFMAPGDPYDTGFKVEVVDHIQAEGELRVHEQLRPAVYKDGKLIAKPQIITIGYSEYWQSPEDDGGNAAQLPPPPDSTLPPTATAPAGVPQPAQPQQEAQAPVQPAAQEATQKEPWQMTREEYLAQQVKDFEELVAQSRKKLEDAKREDPDSQSIHVLESVLAFQQNVLKDLRRGKDAGPTHLHHRVIVNGNLAKGLPVPPEVLADYPDLAAKYQPANAPDAPSLRKVAEGVATPRREIAPENFWEEVAKAYGNPGVRAARDGTSGLEIRQGNRWVSLGLPNSWASAREVGVQPPAGYDEWIRAKMKEADATREANEKAAREKSRQENIKLATRDEEFRVRLVRVLESGVTEDGKPLTAKMRRDAEKEIARLEQSLALYAKMGIKPAKQDAPKSAQPQHFIFVRRGGKMFPIGGPYATREDAENDRTRVLQWAEGIHPEIAFEQLFGQEVKDPDTIKAYTDRLKKVGFPPNPTLQPQPVAQTPANAPSPRKVAEGVARPQTERVEPLRAWLESASQDDIRKLFSKNDSDVASLGLQADVRARMMALAEAQGLAGEAAQNVRAYTVSQMIANTGKPGKRLAFIVKDDTGGEWWSNTHIALLGANLKTTTEDIVQISPVINRAMQEATPISEVATIVDYTSGLYVTVFSDGTQVDAKYWEVIRKMNPDQVVSRGGGKPVVAIKGGKPVALITPLATSEARANTAARVAQSQESARPQPATTPKPELAPDTAQEATKKANADLRRKVQSSGEPSQQDVNALQREYASKGYAITRNGKGQYIITKTKGGFNSSTPGQARFGLLRMYSFDAVRDVDAVIAQFESYETAAKADEALVEYAKDKQPHELTYAEIEQFRKVSRLGEDLERAMLERYFYSLPAEQRRAVMNSDEWPSQYSHRMAVEEAYGSGMDVPANVLEELGMTGAPRSAYKRTNTPSPVVAPKPAPKIAEPTPQPKPITVQPGVFPISNARPVQKRDHIIALYPNRVGGKFSPADIEAVKEWAQSEQATVVASPTVITVTGPLGKNWAATAMKAVESVRGLTVRQARNKAAVDQYNQRVEAKNAADKAYIAANSDVAEWLASVFGDNFANPYNQAALIRYLVGDAKKFDGGMNPSWVPGLEKLGLNSSNASNLKTNDIAAVIKQAWQAQSQKAPAKAPESVSPGVQQAEGSTAGVAPRNEQGLTASESQAARQDANKRMMNDIIAGANERESKVKAIASKSKYPVWQLFNGQFAIQPKKNVLVLWDPKTESFLPPAKAQAEGLTVMSGRFLAGAAPLNAHAEQAKQRMEAESANASKKQAEADAAQAKQAAQAAQDAALTRDAASKVAFKRGSFTIVLSDGSTQTEDGYTFTHPLAPDVSYGVHKYTWGARGQKSKYIVTELSTGFKAAEGDTRGDAVFNALQVPMEKLRGAIDRANARKSGVAEPTAQKAKAWEMTRAEYDAQFPYNPIPPEFQRSKIQEPVYHGAPVGGIKEFFTTPDKTGGNTGARNTKLGAFFSESPDIAATAAYGFNVTGAASRTGTALYQVRINSKKPLMLDNLGVRELSTLEQAMPGFTARYKQLDDKMPMLRWIAAQSDGTGRDILQRLGYDSIVLNTTADSGESLGAQKQYVVFDSGNIFIERETPTAPHDIIVSTALDRGEPVPQRVLADYPEMVSSRRQIQATREWVEENFPDRDKYAIARRLVDNEPDNSDIVGFGEIKEAYDKWVKAQSAPTQKQPKPRTQAQQRADAKKRDAALQDLVYGTPGTVIEKRLFTDTVVSYDKKQGTVVVSRTEDGRNMGQFPLMGGLDKRDVVSITAPDGTVLYANRKLTDAAKERVEAMLAPKKPKPQSPAEPKVVGGTKQPWQMTAREYNFGSGLYAGELLKQARDAGLIDEEFLGKKDGQGYAWSAHKMIVATALKRGLPVPPEVLADYPDLAAQQAKPQSPAEPKVVAKTPQRLRYNEIIAEYAKSRGASVFDGNSPTGRIAAQDAFKQVQKEFPWVRNFGDLDRQSPDILASPSKPSKSKDTITVDGKERPRTNSNGQPIHPTEEGIRAFWRWFGDSKVVDEQGRPLVVYHGSPDATFGAFRPESFFTADPAVAEIYTSPGASSISSRAKEASARGVYPVYLKIESPFDTRIPAIRKDFKENYYRQWGTGTDLQDSGLPDWNDARDIAEWIDEEGKSYDGMMLDEGGLPQDDGTVRSRGISYVPLSPTQIKSAIGNQGTFSPDNPSILASPRRVRRGMAPEPIKWEVAALPYDGPAIPLSDLRIDLEQAFGKLRTGTSAKGTKGVYVISPDIKYVRYGNDVVTAAHEIAHQLDARQGITNNIAGPALDQLRSGYFDRTIPENASQEVADMERFAVLVEAYVSDPERLKALAPELFGWMEKILPPKSLAALKNFSTKLRQYAGQSATAKASSSFVMGRQVNPIQRTVENIKAGSVERFTDNLTQGWLDQYGALRRSVDRIIGGGDRKEGARKRKENPLMDWEVALRDVPYTDEMFTAQMQEGFIDRRLSEQTGSIVTAPSFVQLVSHLEPGTDKFEENYRKATAYMNALRHLDWADRKKSEAEANIEAYTDAVNETKDAAIAQKRLDLMTKAVENGASNIELAIKPELDAYTKRINAIAKGKITRFSNAERKHAIRMGEESGLVAMGPGIKSTVEEARRALKELEPDMKMLRAFEKDYRALSDYNLNMLVWGGRLTPDQAMTIRANNPHWFAVIRIDDREASLEEVVRAHLRPTRSIFGARNLVHSFQGSQRTKDDPLAALATRMRDVMQESHRNRALAQMTYLLKNAGFADGMEGELNRVRLEDGIAPTENQFTIWVNGEKQVWEVSKENSAVLQSMRAILMQSEDGKVLEAILNVLSKPASITRNLIINAPPFIVRNLTRDTIHRMTMVENFGPGAKVPKQSGLAESMGVGLGRSTVFEDPDSFVRRQKDALDDLTSTGHIVLRGRRAYQNLRESAEMVNRKAVFDQAYRAFRASGYNEYQATTLAAYAARESMTDFKKIGSKARALSQIIPFFSAQIAGTSTSIRQLGKNPAQVIKKLTAYSAVLMGLEQLWAALGGDDEEKELERLNNLDRYQRELFWNFRVGGDDGFWLSIPKGHEQSIYTTMVGQLAASLNEGRFGKPDSNRVPRAFVDNLLPVSTLPDAFGGWLPLVELVFNKKMYNDREVVPDHERNKEMSRRNIQYASPIGKALHGFLGVDARQWDYALEEMTGYYGRAITGMAEAENPDDAGRILLRFTGLNMPGSPTQNENVIAVDNLLRTFGKRPTGWESMKKAFFNAKTEAERQRAGRALVNRAKIVRERLEAWKPLPDEARKANVDLLFP